jgi:S1-C subfamily serine protease
LISGIERNSPADDSGIERGLVIYRVGQHDVNSVKDVENLLSRARSGMRVDFTLGVVRAGGAGQRVETVTLAAR